jgi:uncharacterized membrane protein YgaE (UPF0421/DUF939 family)
MFNISDSSQEEEEEEEEKVTEKADIPLPPPDTVINKKVKSTVQFPVDLEQRFYHQDPKPPVEEEEEEDQDPLPPSRKEQLLNYLHVKFPSRIVRRVLKCTIAYFLSTLFSLILPLGYALGPAPFLATTGMLFSHPGRSMGAQFDATVTAVLGVVAAVLWAFAGMAVSVAYNVRHLETYLTDPTGRTANAIFLFVGIFGAQMLRQVFPKFHFFSLQFMIIQIFTMTRAIDFTTMPFDLPLNFGVPLIIGAGISLLVNLVFWPETAVDGLGRALKETIGSSRDMLHMITKQFFLDPQSDPVAESVVNDTSAKMRKGMTKVKAAYKEAKYEMSYAYIRPQQLGPIRKSLDRLTKHLSILGGCLKTERELFESAIEALQAEMHDCCIDSDEDNDSATNRNSTCYSSDNEEINRNSLNRHSYSEEDLNLLRTALRATNDFVNGKHYHTVHAGSLHPSTSNSPRHSRPSSRINSRPNSRPSSRPNSRPASVYNSEEDEDSCTEHNQKSVSSLKSFLALPKLSIPKPKPPKKTKKQTEYHHRHLLLTYLESLRDPLMELSLDCSNALDCVCDSIASELDMDHDDDKRKQTWKALLWHTFKMGKSHEVPEVDKERHKGSSQCNCSQSIRLAIIQFDKAERERMHALYEINKARCDNPLDLGMRQELFLVFFFIFTMREVANELQDMTLHMDELRLYSRKASFNGKRRKHLYLPVFNQKMWQKWAKGNNHQNTRDKGGYTFGKEEENKFLLDVILTLVV